MVSGWRRSTLGACASFLLLAGPAAAQQPPTVSTPTPAPEPAKPRTLPPLSPAEIDNKLTIGGEDINAKLSATRMTVDTKINGHGPYRFLVDSGADSSVLGMRIARALQLPLGTQAIIHTTTADATVDRVLVDELSFGSSVTQNLELPALDEADIGGDGLLGIDVLVNQRLMMDFEKRLIRVEDARIAAQMVAGEIIVTARRRRGQLILTQVQALDLPVEAVIDTGSEITIGNLALRDKLMRGNKDKFEKIKIIGVTGAELELQFARIGRLQIGSITLEDVPMAFADVPPFALFGMNKQPALLMGTDLLSVFRRVSLDFKARRVRFQLRKCGTSGIFINISPSMAATRIRAGKDEEVCSR